MKLPVGLVAPHEAGVGRKLKQEVGVSVAGEERIVLVGEMPHHALHTDHLTPLQSLEEGDAVE